MRITFFIACSFTMGVLCSELSAQKRTSLDENWKFHFGHAANPEKDFQYSLATVFAKSGGAAGTAIDPRYNDSSWRSLHVPHDWAVELPFVKHPDFGVESHGY
jgi:beta-galactosidase